MSAVFAVCILPSSVCCCDPRAGASIAQSFKPW